MKSTHTADDDNHIISLTYCDCKASRLLPEQNVTLCYVMAVTTVEPSADK